MLTAITTMGRKPGLTEFERGQITAMHDLKKPISHIAEALKRSRDCISRFLLSPKTYGVRKGCKGKAKLSPSDLRTIKREARSKKMSARDITLVNN